MTLRQIIMALIVVFCWGANFAAAKMGMEHFPPFLMLALRFAVVAAVLMPFYLKRTIPLKFIFMMALVLGTIHFGLVFGGMAYGIDIPTAVITVQLGVPFSCVLSAVFFDDRLGAWRSFGLVIAFMGIIFMAGTPNVTENFFPFVMLIVGAFFWAVSNILMKRQGTLNVLELLAWQAMLSVPQIMLISLLVESNHVALIQSTPLSAVLAILFSGIGSTVIAYGIWYKLLGECDVSRVAPFNLVVPFIGIAVGQIFYDDPLAPQAIAGGLITILGVAIIVMRRPRLAELGKILKVKAR